MNFSKNLLAFLALSFFLMESCNETTPAAPKLTTSEITDITSNSAKSTGTINLGGTNNEVGVCWSETASPSIKNYKVAASSSSAGWFFNELTNLTSGTKYYVRSYLILTMGVAYGNEVTFSTFAKPLKLPELTTTKISTITSTSASSGGSIALEPGTLFITGGICWSTTTGPTIGGDYLNTTADGRVGVFESNMDNLSGATTYYVRAYAVNELGTAYGNEVSFTTNK